MSLRSILTSRSILLLAKRQSFSSKLPQAALCFMLDILGWNFDREGPESDDFSQLVKALGVQFDLLSVPTESFLIATLKRESRKQ